MLQISEIETRKSEMGDSSDDLIAKRVERAKYVYDQVNGWIGNADNKVSVSCGVFTGAFGVITFLGEAYVRVLDQVAVVNTGMSTLHTFALGGALVLMAMALVFYAKALRPDHTSAKKAKGSAKFPIFYGDIAGMELDLFERTLCGADDKVFVRELAAEIHTNSRICKAKMENLARALGFSFCSILMALVSLYAKIHMYG